MSQRAVEIVANPTALVDKVTTVAKAIEDPADTLAIGAVDVELAPLLESSLRACHVAAFNPEGSKVKREGFHQLLKLIARSAAGADFDQIRELLRVPEMDRYLNRKLETWNGQAARRALDDSFFGPSRD